MTEDELLECPFCGGKPIVITRNWYIDPEFMGCPQCDIFMRPHKWNSRMFPAWLREKIEELKKGYYCSDVLDKVLSLTPGDNP